MVTAIAEPAGPTAVVALGRLGDRAKGGGDVPTGSVPVFLRWAIGLGWVLSILAWIAGWGRALGHDHLIEHGPGLGPALALLLGGWLVMMAAMMLPSSLSTFRRFEALSAVRTDRQRLQVTFLAGYIAVWTGFGGLAFLGDTGLHGFVDGWPWLAARPWIIGGSVLALAGVYELSPLSGRCGRRTAEAVLQQRLRPSTAMRLGADHGLHRLGRCWALMLLSFAVGMASPGWMVALTVVMVLQEREGDGRRVAFLTGVTLLALAGLVIVHPGWMPSLLPSRA